MRAAATTAVTAGLASRIATAGLDWIVPTWTTPPGVGAMMTTRNGGVSRGGAATLDIGPTDLAGLSPDARSAIDENRRRVAPFLPGPAQFLHQVHKADVVRIERAHPCGAPLPVADAAVTRASDVVLGVRVADCLPVLFCDAAGSVVAAAHAGWRGLAAGVLEATIGAMDVESGQVRAWIGPGIGREAFEVGEDVRRAFVERDAHCERHFRPRRAGKWLADLAALARRRLEGAGVTDVAALDACTFSEPARFFSYRRDHGAGRMAAFVWRSDR